MVELTNVARPGKNHLIVSVDNLWDARLAPRAGEHQFNGGIYRDVQLILTEFCGIEEYGVFVQTTKLERENEDPNGWNATVKIDTQVLISALILENIKTMGYPRCKNHFFLKLVFWMEKLCWQKEISRNQHENGRRD